MNLSLTELKALRKIIAYEIRIVVQHIQSSTRDFDAPKPHSDDFFNDIEQTNLAMWVDNYQMLDDLYAKVFAEIENKNS